MTTPPDYIQTIARELNLKIGQVTATAGLLAEGATLPFIARYRKEATGSLDEVLITAIRDRLTWLEALDKRRQAILDSLAERELLTEELRGQLLAAPTLAVLEDLYLPFRPKRRTRGMIARERGLEPLALAMRNQNGRPLASERFIDSEKGVHTVEEALAGARDILAEWLNEDAVTRNRLRRLFADQALIVSKVVKKTRKQGQSSATTSTGRKRLPKCPATDCSPCFGASRIKC